MTKQHLEAEDSQMDIHSPSLSFKFRHLYPVEKFMYFTSISNQVHTKLLFQSPTRPLFLIFTPIFSVNGIKGHPVAQARNQSPLLTLPVLYNQVQHRVLQFYIIVCLSPSHLWSQNLTSPSQKGLLCPFYPSIYFLLLSFVSHNIICNVNIYLLVYLFVCFTYYAKFYEDKSLDCCVH